MRKRAIALPLLTLVALAGLTGEAAQARHTSTPSFTTYKVKYEGSGTYSVHQEDGPSSGTVKSTFKWDTTYLMVVSSKKGSEAGGGSKSSSGSGDWSITSDNGGDEKCSRNGGLKLGTYGGITGKTQSSGTVYVEITPASNDDYTTTNGSSGSQACDTTDFWNQWVVGFSHVGSKDSQSVDPLTAPVYLTREQLRQGKVIANKSNDDNFGAKGQLLVVDPDCGSGNGATCKQSFEWKGTVTFTKQRTRRL